MGWSLLEVLHHGSLAIQATGPTLATLPPYLEALFQGFACPPLPGWVHPVARSLGPTVTVPSLESSVPSMTEKQCWANSKAVLGTHMTC